MTIYLRRQWKYSYLPYPRPTPLSDHSLEIELDRYKNIPRNQKDIVNFVKRLDDEFHFLFDCKVTDNIIPSFIDFMKTKYPHFNQLDSLEK
jgi:hypothetical protein